MFTGGCTCGNFSDGCACSDSSYLVGGKLYAQHLTSVLFLAAERCIGLEGDPLPQSDVDFDVSAGLILT